MRRALAHILVILFLVTSLGAAPGPNNSDSKRKSAVSPKREVRKRPKAYQVGRASWYGKFFHGKQTASGEAYDMFQFTAAHRELPLGTWLRVTNLRNGRWVVVRVNDRGPVPPSRIIDLSYGAATMLELRQHGVERVRLELINPSTLETLAMNTGAM